MIFGLIFEDSVFFNIRLNYAVETSLLVQQISFFFETTGQILSMHFWDFLAWTALRHGLSERSLRRVCPGSGWSGSKP